MPSGCRVPWCVDVTPPGLFVLENPAVVEDETGFTVTVNGRLGYRVAIDDFENENLAPPGWNWYGEATSSPAASIFPGRAGEPYGGGVAHGLTIQAVVGGVAAGLPTAPVTVEARR